jgi:hypothetical protein
VARPRRLVVFAVFASSFCTSVVACLSGARDAFA